jgi:hypothetical protein
MIDKILDLIFGLIKAALSVLPDYTPPNTGMLQSLVNWLVTFNQYLPMVEMVQCMVAYLAFVGIYMVVRPILKFVRVT